ncbi:amidohydrolase 2 [Podospora conica]|nr:amidohydrolase 2 [Schizothecium conicum]
MALEAPAQKLGRYTASPLRTRDHKHDDSLYYITLEEHWLSPAFSDPSLATWGPELTRQGSSPPADITEIGPFRLSNMTANHIRKQVISHLSVPRGLDHPTLAARANDELAVAIACNPERYAGFCFLPMAYPLQAAAELERCVTHLGFVGALFDNHLINGTYLDGAAYRPFWAKAAALGVPIYLHPTWPNETAYLAPGATYAPSGGGTSYPMLGGLLLGSSAWGWHQDAGLHFLRLYAAGIFDEFPTLKIVLGHDGEMLPFMLDRTTVLLGPHNTRAKTSLVATWKRNVWVTTAGMFSLAPLAAVLRTTAVERIMYSVDYPFSSNARGHEFMTRLRGSGMVTEGEWRMVAYGNAEKLLGI